MTETDRLLEGYPLVSSYAIAWGDQDAFGHVNNRVYLYWAESARVEYLMRLGEMPEAAPTGVAPIVASVKCDYRRQTNFPGTVLVGTRISRIGRSSMKMEHVIVSREQAAVVAEVDSTLVMLDYVSGESQPVSREMRETIAALEGKRIEELEPASGS